MKKSHFITALKILSVNQGERKKKHMVLQLDMRFCAHHHTKNNIRCATFLLSSFFRSKYEFNTVFIEADNCSSLYHYIVNCILSNIQMRVLFRFINYKSKCVVF